jgi:hypothetical protein
MFSEPMSGMTTAPAVAPAGAAQPHNRIRVGYARVSTRGQDHQAQLDALAGAHCREVVVETASTRTERPKLRATLDRLQAGDTLVIYEPDRVARSMKELLVFVEDDLHARGVVLEILTGVCAGMHRPDGATIAAHLGVGRSTLYRALGIASNVAPTVPGQPTAETSEASASRSGR